MSVRLSLAKYAYVDYQADAPSSGTRRPRLAVRTRTLANTDALGPPVARLPIARPEPRVEPERLYICFSASLALRPCRLVTAAPLGLASRPLVPPASARSAAVLILLVRLVSRIRSDERLGQPVPVSAARAADPAAQARPTELWRWHAPGGTAEPAHEKPSRPVRRGGALRRVRAPVAGEPEQRADERVRVPARAHARAIATAGRVGPGDRKSVV